MDRGSGIRNHVAAMAAADHDRIAAGVVPVVSENVSPRVARRLYERLDLAAGSLGTPLGKALAAMPAGQAVEVFGAIQSTLFPEVLATPANAPAIAARVAVERAEKIRVKAAEGGS